MWLLGNQFAPWVLEAAESAKYRIINQGGEGGAQRSFKKLCPPEAQIATGYR